MSYSIISVLAITPVVIIVVSILFVV